MTELLINIIYYTAQLNLLTLVWNYQLSVDQKNKSVIYMIGLSITVYNCMSTFQSIMSLSMLYTVLNRISAQVLLF